MRDKILLVVATFLATAALGFLVAPGPVEVAEARGTALTTQNVSSIQGVTVRPNGVVTIDAWMSFSAMAPAPGYPPTPISRPAPSRVEFSADVPKDALLCVSTTTGQTCKPIRDLFPQ